MNGRSGASAKRNDLRPYSDCYASEWGNAVRDHRTAGTGNLSVYGLLSV